MSLLADFKKMALIREVEEHLTDAYDQGMVPGLLHPCFGGEALAVGVAACLTPGTDMIFSSHRCHGHAIAGGINWKAMVDEILGLPTGINCGHAGTQHLNDPAAPQNGSLFMSGNGIVGAQVPLALGAALTARNKGTGGIAVVFFGDGAMNQGGVMEAFNLAVVEKLPVLFICENNGMAQSTFATNVAGGENFRTRAAAFGLKTAQVNGRDVVEVKSILAPLIEAVRAGEPLFLEADIDRLSGHYHGDDQAYRSGPPGLWSPADPIFLLNDLLQEGEGLSKTDVATLRQEVGQEVAAYFVEKGLAYD